MRALLLTVLVVPLLAGAQEETAPDAGVAEEPAPVVLEGMDGGIPGHEPAGQAVTEPPPAEAPADVPAAEPKRAEANGYVLGRFSFTRPRTWGLLPTRDVPVLSLLLEVNGQVKFNYWRSSKVYGDISLVGQAGFIYRELNADGVVQDAAAHDVASVRPLISINELYIQQETIPALTFTVGKKRVVFGPGFAYSPTDILNVRRDPTDPTSQRAGVWLAQAQLSLELFTFDVIFAPGVTESAFGIPYGFVVYPDWDKKDDQAHYQLVARAGALLFDTDINLLFYFGNRYSDAFEKKFRFGATVSRVFFGATEVHAELLMQSGSPRLYFSHSCTADAPTALACANRQEAFVGREQLEDERLRPIVLAGVRHTFPDDSILSAEYLYQSDGYGPAQFQDQINALDLLQQAAALGVPANRIPGASEFLGQGSGSADSTPQRYAFAPTFRHYVFLSYMKGQIFNDFTAQLVTVLNCQDLSTLWTPSIVWSATEWLQLGLYGFFPLQGPDALAATSPTTGKKVSEYSSLPMSWRAFFEMRVFY
jgi:hypothetical protein